MTRLALNLRRRDRIKAIRTRYKDVLFRSRLEAKWAAAFDHFGWEWRYEPIDLEGYVPDFIVTMRRELLVEVKPETTIEGLWEAAAKIDRSGWDGEALIVGTGVLENGVQPVIGLHREMDGDAALWDTGRMFYCLSCGQLSILNTGGSWRCRICGAGEGNEHVGVAANIDAMLADAANRVQWRPGK